MKSQHNIIFGLIAMALVLSFPVLLAAASMGVSHGHDMDGLWARAQKEFDLKAHDAVLLLEGRHVTILDNGNLKTRIHRVVWIGTEVGIEDHADLRIPWNSATSTFTVVAVRTWNDGRWWPDESEVSETAVVETLPFALAQADDYTTMRETMLLHDGVELPCIMETIYEIEQKGAASDGADDLFVFPQSDPALLVEYELTVPATVTPAYRSGNDAPEPETTTGADEATTYTWKMENVTRLGSPRIAFPAEYSPFVNWSTWKDWHALGTAFKNRFDEAAVLNDVISDSLLARLEYEQTPVAKVRAIAELIDEWTRNIHYDWKFWCFSPRPATRTRETAYGHDLDRAVLAAALLRACGVKAEPCVVSATGDRFPYDIPGLSPFVRLGVITRYIGGVDSFYDPADGSLTRSLCLNKNCFFWRPIAAEMEPELKRQTIRDVMVSCFELSLTLVPAEEGKWTGSGYMNAAGMFGLYDKIAGKDDGARAMIKRIVQSVLPSAQIEDYTPECFDIYKGEFIFRFSIDKLEQDDHERIRISIGGPAGGLVDLLPQDIHLYEEHRSSLVMLGGVPMQRVELRLKTENRDIIYMPRSYEMENEVGRFGLTVEREEGWVRIERELNLKKHIVQSEEWPLLRAILLEELDPAHRTIMLK